MAEDLVERMGGAGNVVMVNGVPGTSVDTDRNTGAKEVFSEYPDITVIAELEGQWGSGVAQQVTADFLATQPEIDGVWIQGGGPGVIQAFDDAGYALVPMAGEAETRRGGSSWHLRRPDAGYGECRDDGRAGIAARPRTAARHFDAAAFGDE
jgi:hypothetical protein